MPNNDSNFRKLVKITNSIDFHFSQYSRMVRKEKLLAWKQGDTGRYDRLDKALKESRKHVNEVLDILEDRMLSTEIVNELVSNLDTQTARARKILEDMRKLTDKLKKIEEGAKMALEILTTVKDLIKIV